MAQIAYNCIKRESLVFNEDCPANLQKNMQILPSSSSFSSALQLTLYPNPTTGQLFVLCNQEDVHSAKCIIRGMDGREIYVGSLDFEKGIALSNLSIANGVYTIEINVANETFHEQFVYFK